MIEVHLYQIENGSNSLGAYTMATHFKSLIIGRNYVENLCVCWRFWKVKVTFHPKMFGKIETVKWKAGSFKGN